MTSKPIFHVVQHRCTGRAPSSCCVNRTRLVSYFAARHRDGERLDLRFFRFRGNRSGYRHFVFGLIRRTQSFPLTDYLGKGAAVCTEGRDMIAVWPMAREP